MNKSEKEIDHLIQEALSKEEAAYYAELGEQNMPQKLLSLFRGKNSWLNVVIMLISLVVLSLSIYCFIEMLNTDVISDKLEWAFYALIGFMSNILFKIWSWNQMDKNSLLREIKRLEFQVSLLGKKG